MHFKRSFQTFIENCNIHCSKKLRVQAKKWEKLQKRAMHRHKMKCIHILKYNKENEIPKCHLWEF